MTLETNVASPELRNRAHDIRNLFGAIASARHLFDDGPDESRRVQLLDAIEDAAIRGGALTTKLLEAGTHARVERIEPGKRLAELAPLLQGMAGRVVTLTLDIDRRTSALRADPEQFDRIVLELAANARAAIGGTGIIRLRLRARHGRIILLVADDGHGMDAAGIRRLLCGPAGSGAHGTGFQQVRAFVARAHGSLRVRSTPGRGTVICLELPALLQLTVAPAPGRLATTGPRRRLRKG